jgi:hypothetical protein
MNSKGLGGKNGRGLCHFPRGTEEIFENFKRDSQSAGREANLGLSNK